MEQKALTHLKFKRFSNTFISLLDCRMINIEKNSGPEYHIQKQFNDQTAKIFSNHETQIYTTHEHDIRLNGKFYQEQVTHKF